tara:strand:- start:178 stop:432 length:255 start_codon:yes stop_codon:yes gene_type:complete
MWTLLNKMSLLKTYTSVSHRIFEATEPGGERDEPGLVTKQQWKDLIAERKEKRRKKLIQRTWKTLVFNLLRKHAFKKSKTIICF